MKCGKQEKTRIKNKIRKTRTELGKGKMPKMKNVKNKECHKSKVRKTKKKDRNEA